MKPASLIGICVLALSQCAVVIAEGEGDSKEIPLDQIWGYNLPGTKDIGGIPLPEKPGFGQSLEYLRRQREHNIEQMRVALTAKHPTQQAVSGFVLRRQADFFMLQGVSNRARGLLHHPPKVVGVVGDQFPPSDTFRAGEELTLVFFSHPLSYYVRLREVKLDDNEIIVQYEFEPHTKPEVTVHFALIPLGELPAGEYHVDYQQIPLDEKYREVGFEPVEPDASTIICRDFSFKIIDLPKANQPPTPGATLIPLNQIFAYDMPDTRDVRELEPQLPGAGAMSEQEFTRSHKIQQILRSLQPKPKDKAGPAFVVVGTGKDALKNARDVFVKEKEPAKVLPADTDLTLVFYSFMLSRYVQIESVQKVENQITVNYRIVSHPTYTMTTHFALIPLGKLPEGTVEVRAQQVESNNRDDQRLPPLSDPLRYVSDSFSFEVRR